MDMIFTYLHESLVALIAAAVCAAIALAALFQLLTSLLRNSSAKPTAGGLACVWRRDDLQPAGETARWLCSTCGASSPGAGNKPPAACLRQAPKPAL